ncbi:hypothetical protein SCOCK_60198 [Actinacidiphila cocklensis]|uniref:Putative T7SS secretion signal domain-containing protein n=1 Tax=Actinacidiphila cocklensis TaxID=887465 RepID=A0A9W4DXB1_9ACTN|nr:hypothetical protein SCOCK_60198 [Actinacidiphila cocklensis]
MGFSWKGAVNKVGDGIEHGVDKVKKKAGAVIDHGAHIVGDGLEHVGLDDAADWVEDKGDQVADHLGAHVAEQQLGQTNDPKELLHGDPSKIREAVLHLAKLSLAFDTGHTGLSHLDPGDWDGEGAEAFRAKFKAQPSKWAHAATACAQAGLALETYAETVDWAIGQAKEAVRLWKQGVAARKAAADAYNTAVDQYHDDVKAYNDKVDDGKDPGTKPVKPADFTDPGAKDKQAAKDTLDTARKQRDSAAATAEAKVRTATELAPKKPDFSDRMQNDFGDVGKAAPIAAEHFAGGLVRSVTDLDKFVRGLDPMDPYNLTHPAQYLTHLNATAAGLVDMTQHPERLPGIILGTGWGSDGSEASGRLIGNILLAIATDGGSAAGKTAAENAAKNAAKDAAEQAARGGARAAAEDPAKAAIEQAAKKCVSDPIDVATGDMILPARHAPAGPGTHPPVVVPDRPLLRAVLGVHPRPAPRTRRPGSRLRRRRRCDPPLPRADDRRPDPAQSRPSLAAGTGRPAGQPPPHHQHRDGPHPPLRSRSRRTDHSRRAHSAGPDRGHRPQRQRLRNHLRRSRRTHRDPPQRRLPPHPGQRERPHHRPARTGPDSPRSIRHHRTHLQLRHRRQPVRGHQLLRPAPSVHL